MEFSDRKYVVNIDFPISKSEGGHKIHLNPYFSGSSFREKILRHYDPEEHKSTEDGGPYYLSRDQAIDCLKGNLKLSWLGRIAFPFRPCLICNKLPDWDIK